MKKMSPQRIAKQILLGTTLGDGNISPNGVKKARLRLGHGICQLDYLLWKIKMLKPLVGSFSLGERKSQSWSKYTVFGSQTLTSRYLWHIYNDFYFERNGKIKKEIHSNVLNRLTPLSIAVWYMDDGCLGIYKTRGSNAGKLVPWGAHLATHSFTYQEQELICEYFKRKWDIGFHILKQGDGYFIVSDHKDTRKFLNLVEPHVIERMRYKVDTSYQRTKHPDIVDDDVLRTLWEHRDLIRNVQALTYKGNFVFNTEKVAALA